MEKTKRQIERPGKRVFFVECDTALATRVVRLSKAAKPERMNFSAWIRQAIREKAEREEARGFTLTELLICIAIIAVLIGVLLPALSSVRESARNAKCLAHLHTIGQAFGDYRGNHRGDAPLPDDLEIDSPAWVCPCFAARNRDSTQPHFSLWSFTNARVYGAILDTRPAATWPITGDMTVANHGGKAVAVGTPPVMQYVLRGGFQNSVYLDGHAGRKQ